MSQLRMNVNNRNGGNIRLLEDVSVVSADYPGYLYPYRKAQENTAPGMRSDVQQI